MHQLSAFLAAAFPGRTAQGERLVSLLSEHFHRVPSMQAFAALAGFRTRHQLGRRLRAEGLPPYEVLLGWARVLDLLLAHQASGTSLRRSAVRQGRDPAVWYRLVERVTGYRWSALRHLGPGWVVLEIRRRSGTGPRVQSATRQAEGEATRALAVASLRAQDVQRATAADPVTRALAPARLASPPWRPRAPATGSP